MSTDEAIRIGLILSGPMLSIVGAFFAVSVSSNEHVNGVVKGIAWVIAPLAGLLLGNAMAAELLPGLGRVGAAIMFGHGWFLVFIAAAAIGHDDSKENYISFIRWVWPKLQKAFRRKKKKDVKVTSDELATYIKRQLESRE
ncbi:MAG: hypothetical protein AAGD92_15160 [Pseudomonadota bacterium]